MKYRNIIDRMLFVSAILISVALFHSNVSASENSKLPPPPAPVVTDPDVREDRLCDESADPDAAPDKIHINCKLEYGEFADKSAAVPEGKPLLVVAYNLERGMKFDEQVALLKNNPEFAQPDIIMISESDRGCSRTNYRNVTRDLAKALGMNYAYGVEYMELPRPAKIPTDDNKTLCEHGNAVLSKYPIVGLDQIRHKDTQNWYIPPGPGRAEQQPRLGGVMAVVADVAVPGKGTLRVYSVHLDSMFQNGDEMRAGQAKEILTHLGDTPGPVVIGGDMNTVSYFNDLQSSGHSDSATQVFFASGFKDAHTSIPYKKRYTTKMEYGMRFVLDVIVTRGAEVTDSGICPTKICGTLSDHLPVWTRIKF